MTPALVATDLDGTLVRSDYTISARTVDALASVVAAGGHVVLATARPIRWMARIYAQLPVPPIAVCANGAAIYDPVADELLHHAAFEPVALAEVCAALRAEVPEAAFAVEIDGGRRLLHEPTFTPGGWEIGHPDVRAVSPQDMLTQYASKLLVKAGDQAADAFTARVAKCLFGIAEATHSSNGGRVEVSAPGVTKAAGLAWVAGRLGVSAEDVVAFGDMPNDLPMLAWAGRAVATANAHPSVLAAAHEVTGSCDDDGVAAYLERWLAAA